MWYLYNMPDIRDCLWVVQFYSYSFYCVIGDIVSISIESIYLLIFLSVLFIFYLVYTISNRLDTESRWNIRKKQGELWLTNDEWLTVCLHIKTGSKARGGCSSYLLGIKIKGLVSFRVSKYININFSDNNSSKSIKYKI